MSLGVVADCDSERVFFYHDLLKTVNRFVATVEPILRDLG